MIFKHYFRGVQNWPKEINNIWGDISEKQKPGGVGEAFLRIKNMAQSKERAFEFIKGKVLDVEKKEDSEFKGGLKHLGSCEVLKSHLRIIRLKNVVIALLN